MELSTLEIILIAGIIISISISVFTYLRSNSGTSNLIKLTKNIEGKNIEEILREYLKSQQFQKGKIVKIEKDLEKLKVLSKANIQRVGFMRYNPFHETGGDQSFILALLNGNDSGVIISTLHQRDVTRVYAKLIKKGESENKLSDEEKKLLAETLEK